MGSSCPSIRLVLARGVSSVEGRQGAGLLWWDAGAAASGNGGTGPGYVRTCGQESLEYG